MVRSRGDSGETLKAGRLGADLVDVEKSRIAAQIEDAKGDAAPSWAEPPPQRHRMLIPPRRLAPEGVTPAEAERDRVLAAARARMPEVEAIARGERLLPVSAARPTTSPDSRVDEDVSRARQREQTALAEAAQIRDELAQARYRIAELESQLDGANARIHELELVTRVSPVDAPVDPAPAAPSTPTWADATNVPVVGDAPGSPTRGGYVDGRWVETDVAPNGNGHAANGNGHAPTADDHGSNGDGYAPNGNGHAPSGDGHVEVAADTGDAWAMATNGSSIEGDAPADLAAVAEEAQTTLRELLAKAAAARRGGPTSP